MNVAEDYFYEGEWDIKGMKSDIKIIRETLESAELDKLEEKKDMVGMDNDKIRKLKERQKTLSDNYNFGSIVMIMNGEILNQISKSWALLLMVKELLEILVVMEHLWVVKYIQLRKNIL